MIGVGHMYGGPGYYNGILSSVSRHSISFEDRVPVNDNYFYTKWQEILLAAPVIRRDDMLDFVFLSHAAPVKDNVLQNIKTNALTFNSTTKCSRKLDTLHHNIFNEMRNPHAILQCSVGVEYTMAGVVSNGGDTQAVLRYPFLPSAAIGPSGIVVCHCVPPSVCPSRTMFPL